MVDLYYAKYNFHNLQAHTLWIVIFYNLLNFHLASYEFSLLLCNYLFSTTAVNLTIS